MRACSPSRRTQQMACLCCQTSALRWQQVGCRLVAKHGDAAHATSCHSAGCSPCSLRMRWACGARFRAARVLAHASLGCLLQAWLLLMAAANDTRLQRHMPYSACTFQALCATLCMFVPLPALLPSSPADFILTSWNFIPSSWSAPGTSPTIICPTLESGVQWTAGNATSECLLQCPPLPMLRLPLPLRLQGRPLPLSLLLPTARASAATFTAAANCKPAALGGKKHCRHWACLPHSLRRHERAAAALRTCQPNHTTRAPTCYADASLPTIFADANAVPVSSALLHTWNSSETPTNALTPAQLCAHAAPNARLQRACLALPPAATCAFVPSCLPPAC